MGWGGGAAERAWSCGACLKPKPRPAVQVPIHKAACRVLQPVPPAAVNGCQVMGVSVRFNTAGSALRGRRSSGAPPYKSALWIVTLSPCCLLFGGYVV